MQLLPRLIRLATSRRRPIRRSTYQQGSGAYVEIQRVKACAAGRRDGRAADWRNRSCWCWLFYRKCRMRPAFRRSDRTPAPHRGGAPGAALPRVGSPVRSTVGRATRPCWNRKSSNTFPATAWLKHSPAMVPWRSMVGRGTAPRPRGDRGRAVPSAGDGGTRRRTIVVFVPATPAPMSGALYMFTPDKVMYLDVPLLSFMKAIRPGASACVRSSRLQKGTDRRRVRTDHTEEAL